MMNNTASARPFTPSAPAASLPPVPTLYVFQWGVYARRILLQLSLKFGGTSSCPYAIVPITIVPDSGFHLPCGARYPSTTVPALHMPCGRIIRNSMAIAEYIEHTQAGAPSLLADTALDAAHVRDLCDTLDDAGVYFCQAVRYSVGLYARNHEQDANAARMAFKDFQRYLKEVESIAGTGGGEGKWLAGGESPSLADCWAAALCQYVDVCYGLRDLLAPHERIVGAWKAIEGLKAEEGGIGPMQPPEEWIGALMQQKPFAGEEWWGKA